MTPIHVRMTFSERRKYITGTSLLLHRAGPWGTARSNRRVGHIDLPEDLLIAFIRRGNDIVIPHGPTELEEGDFVTFIGHAGAAEAIAVRYARGETRPAPVPLVDTAAYSPSRLTASRPSIL